MQQKNPPTAHIVISMTRNIEDIVKKMNMRGVTENMTTTEVGGRSMFINVNMYKRAKITHPTCGDDQIITTMIVYRRISMIVATVMMMSKDDSGSAMTANGSTASTISIITTNKLIVKDKASKGIAIAQIRESNSDEIAVTKTDTPIQILTSRANTSMKIGMIADTTTIISDNIIILTKIKLMIILTVDKRLRHMQKMTHLSTEFIKTIFIPSNVASAQIANGYLTHFKTALLIMNAITNHNESTSQTGTIMYHVNMYDILLPNVIFTKVLLEGNIGGNIVCLQSHIILQSHTILLAHGADIHRMKHDREAVVVGGGN